MNSEILKAHIALLKEIYPQLMSVIDDLLIKEEFSKWEANEYYCKINSIFENLGKLLNVINVKSNYQMPIEVKRKLDGK